MERRYQQLQPEERLTIASLHLQGSSIRAMARMLGRSPSTVSRELARNCGPESYTSVSAQAFSVARRIAIGCFPVNERTTEFVLLLGFRADTNCPKCRREAYTGELSSHS